LTPDSSGAQDVPARLERNQIKGNAMKKLILAATATLGIFTLAATAEATVLRVVVVQATDSAAYMNDLAKIRATLTRLGSKSTMRVWRTRFAGPDAGAIVVSIEYPDMATFAAEDAKIQADAEYTSLIKGLDRVRKIVSDSLYEEMK
jgi:hypothetical protein